jgi:hypothetical protein
MAADSSSADHRDVGGAGQVAEPERGISTMVLMGNHALGNLVTAREWRLANKKENA